MTDDQHDIEERLMKMIIMETASQPKAYHCAYCHSVWRETSSGKCKSCGSGSKLCKSCNNSQLSRHR